MDLFAFMQPGIGGVGVEYAHHLRPGLSAFARGEATIGARSDWGALAGVRWEW